MIVSSNYPYPVPGSGALENACSSLNIFGAEIPKETEAANTSKVHHARKPSGNPLF